MTHRDLVVFSLEPWDNVWRRNQYLIDGLLRRDPELRVLFVEPANDMLHSLLAGRGLRRRRRFRVAIGYEGRLTMFQPTKILPRVVGPAADMLLRRGARRAIRTAGMRNPILWVNDPSWATLVARSSWPALYDMTDDWLAARRSRREHRRIVANEDILMGECQTVVACSEHLRRTRQRQRDVVLIPNAVDVDRYRVARARPGDLPQGRTALYVGTLHEDRLDVDLLLRTADALRDDETLVLLGPVALAGENSARLSAHARIALLGPRPWIDIPSYLQHAEVLIVPHLVNAFTDSLDPLKLYEYRAVGRPIVSTPVAGFRDLDRGLMIAAPRAFPGAVARVIRADLPAARYDVPDWSARVEEFAAVLEQMWTERDAER